jgi:Flp pilus assembly protein TadD
MWNVRWRSCARLALIVMLLVVPVDVLADPSTSTGQDDDPDYTAAVKAIQNNDFSGALPLLRRVVARDPRHADAYNWLGYATRRTGDPAAAIPIYQRALAIDPKHRGAHEYIGEAYLLLDDVARAKQHLATLRALCSLPCPEHSDLAKAVDAYEKSAGKIKPTASP